MEIRTYRARTLEQALAYVHQEMGPEARIVHARELETSWWERVSKGRQFEIRTGEQANNPLSLRRCGANDLADPVRTQMPFESEVDDLAEFRQRFRQPPFSSESHRSTDLFAEGSLNPRPAHHGLSIELPNRNEMTYAPVVFELLTRLIEADVSPVAARELVDIVRSASVDNAQWTLHQWQQALLQQLLSELPRGGAIRVTPDRRKTIALVGPTGVGKTTTIAKLAANWRLHDHCRIGLVTVDTYRVAAVEQLRTYAEIMDLPMEVVTTPREMRAAVARFADQDLILIDTAGRSPHDALQLQELRSLLGEANADEVQLVLSGVSSASHIQQTVHRFMEVGTTGLVVTKLDETTSLGNLLATLREVRLPVSYLTCGQNVPDDIVPADPQRFVPSLLGFKPLDSAV